MKPRLRAAGAEFNADGQRVLTASADRAAQLWNAITGKAIGRLMGHKGPTTSARFSPDGQWVVTASADHTARLWDAATGKAIGEPMKQDDGVTSARFSADGQRVLTASADGTARLWDVPTISREDTAEALLLFADLAEASGGVALQTSGQASVNSLGTAVTGRALNRYNAWAAIRKRAKAAGFLTPVGCHTWAGNRHHDLSGERRSARARPADGRTRISTHHEAVRSYKGRNYTERGGAYPVVTFDSYAVLPRLRNARLRSESLRRLKTDRIDLYPNTKIEDAMAELIKLENGPRPGSWRRETYGTGSGDASPETFARDSSAVETSVREPEPLLARSAAAKQG